jgi:hypothetical protein
MIEKLNIECSGKLFEFKLIGAEVLSSESKSESEVSIIKTTKRHTIPGKTLHTSGQTIFDNGRQIFVAGSTHYLPSTDFTTESDQQYVSQLVTRKVWFGKCEIPDFPVRAKGDAAHNYWQGIIDPDRFTSGQKVILIFMITDEGDKLFAIHNLQTAKMQILIGAKLGGFRSLNKNSYDNLVDSVIQLSQKSFSFLINNDYRELMAVEEKFQGQINILSLKQEKLIKKKKFIENRGIKWISVKWTLLLSLVLIVAFEAYHLQSVGWDFENENGYLDLFIEYAQEVVDHRLLEFSLAFMMIVPVVFSFALLSAKLFKNEKLSRAIGRVNDNSKEISALQYEKDNEITSRRIEGYEQSVMLLYKKIEMKLHEYCLRNLRKPMLS